MPAQSWKLISQEILRDYKILSIREDTYHFAPSDIQAGFVVCDSADWVLVIPVTVDEQVVFVRQFRHGRAEVVLEIPGGVMEAGEDPAHTAARELQEETGYVPESVKMCGRMLPNPAMNTARCHVALATGCQLVGAPNPDPLEHIETELRPLSSVDEMIRSGELQHALCIAAFAVARPMKFETVE